MGYRRGTYLEPGTWYQYSNVSPSAEVTRWVIGSRRRRATRREAAIPPRRPLENANILGSPTSSWGPDVSAALTTVPLGSGLDLLAAVFRARYRIARPDPASR